MRPRRRQARGPGIAVLCCGWMIAGAAEPAGPIQPAPVITGFAGSASSAQDLATWVLQPGDGG